MDVFPEVKKHSPHDERRQKLYTYKNKFDITRRILRNSRNFKKQFPNGQKRIGKYVNIMEEFLILIFDKRG